MELDLVEASSYGDAMRSRGDVALRRWMSRPVQGRSVLVVDDIVDTGATLSDVRDLIRGSGPRDLAACALLDKPARRTRSVALEYCGFVIDNHFVVGYGLDRAGLYRNLPYIGVVQS
jgi:hypoxanthine phosphoribosyltransferase